MSLSNPTYLKPGDEIRIIACAKKIDSDKLTSAIATMEGWGLKVSTGKNISAEFGLLAGTDQQRAQDLQLAINDPKVKAIISFRGGYGSVRICELVDFSSLKATPKWLIGFSDITVLHLVFRKLGINSIHGTMPINFEENTDTALLSLKQALFGESYSILGSASDYNRNGFVKAPLVGGNLSIINSLSGTKYDLETDGKILFLEDLDEYFYHIERMMYNLKLGGKLDGIKGLVIGGMTGLKDNAVAFDKSIYEIINHLVAAHTYPVCFDFPVGHFNHNHALVLGSEVTLDVGQKVRMSFNFD